MATLLDTSNFIVDESSNTGLTPSDLMNTNWQTTAAVGLTVATGGVTGALMLTAFPAQTLAAAGGISALAYAGKRRADGKSAFPFTDKSDAKSDKKSDVKSAKKADVKSEEKTEDKSED